MTDPFPVGSPKITLEDVVQVARAGRSVAWDPASVRAVLDSRRAVERLLAQGRVVYGITTGFGKFADTAIDPAAAAELQLNLLRSHAVGVGEPLSEEIVRAVLLLRAHALALGYSGVSPAVVERMIDLLNAGVHPVIPAQGSLGASGDLAPLAHLALVLVGEGEAVVDGRRLPGRAALAERGLVPVVLGPKDGLALINGTQVMTAIGALATLDARTLCLTADVAAALAAEAYGAITAAYDERLARVRPHPGQIASADNLRRLLAGSRLTSKPGQVRVQDPYTLRCVPQVHGASRQAVTHAAAVLAVEMNSATDNPLLFPNGEEHEVISGGNFHGEPVALALDYLAIGAAELANLAERRIERLVNPQLSGLPAFLTRRGGLHSGLMIVQYTAAALVSENKVLCHPASVDSIPSSANQEDHVSMGTIAARKAARVVAQTARVLAIELLVAAQALEFRDRAAIAEPTRAIYDAVRETSPPLDADRPLAGEIETLADRVLAGDFVRAAEDRLDGPLVAP